MPTSDGIKCAKHSRAIWKRRAMELIAPSGNTTLPAGQPAGDREPEARRNNALTRVTKVEGKVAAHDAAKLATVADPASLAMLPADLKTVWTALSTDPRLKERIVRIVIHEVIADIDPAAAEIVLTIHWIGRRSQRDTLTSTATWAAQQRCDCRSSTTDADRQ